MYARARPGFWNPEGSNSMNEKGASTSACASRFLSPGIIITSSISEHAAASHNPPPSPPFCKSA